LLIACGLSGSGKSRLGRALRESLPLIQVRSDVERKRLFAAQVGGDRVAIPGSGIYSREATELTYARLARVAESILRSGYDALVDATFLARSRRRAMGELATGLGAGFGILAMDAPIEILRQRVVRRLEEGCDASEATLKVLEAQAAGFEPLDSAEQGMALEIDSSDPPEMDWVLERIAEVTGIPLGD
jgi:predicted kinase